MKFAHYKFGHCRGGEVVEVVLSGSAANVRLMNDSDFQNYRSGRRHRYRGGLVKQSPFRMQIPTAGNWNVTVDMQGLQGSVRSSARILPGALPEISQRPLSSVPSLLLHPDATPGVYSSAITFDVFISHASEDKDEIVRPLAHALQAGGLRVWYDEFELRIGDSLRRKIDQGLAKSRFGIVVLSRTFINKGWANYELDGIVTKAVSGQQVLLPIWHNISKQEVIDFSPSLADKLARNTATNTAEEIAAEIIALIQDR